MSVDINPGDELKEDGMDQALRAYSDWQDAFRTHAAYLAATGTPFTSEDVLNDVGLPSGGVRSNGNNAVGALMNALARSGVIRKTGMRVRSRRPSSHSAELTQWVGAQPTHQHQGATMHQPGLVEPNRDRWGKPLITQPDGTQLAYYRPSSAAAFIEDTSNLTKWKMRQVIAALAAYPDLHAIATTTDPSDSRALNDLAAKAMDRMLADKSANIGTSIHKATEMLDHGQSVDHLPSDILAAAKAYREAVTTANMTPVLGEVFAVCDELRFAGTFDRLFRHTVSGGHAIGDLKTSEPKGYDVATYSAMKWSIQTAIYAHSVPYCAQRGRLSWADLGVTAPSQDRAVIVHLTQGTDSASLYLADIRTGWALAQLAASVRDARRTTRADTLVTPL